MSIQRRDFLKYAGGGLVSTAAGLMVPHRALAKSKAAKAKVVVVGAGYGGATCARYLRIWDPSIEVTLIDPNPHMVSCPMSNWVLGGLREMKDLDKPYDGLKKQGIKLVQDSVVAVDGEKRIVKTQGGGSFAYDRLVLSPGVEFMGGTIEGFDAAYKADKVVHAFNAGRETLILKKQLEAMPDGGVYVIASPPPTGKCVSGPYERACMVAHYFKQHKPKCKIIMLDGHFDVVSKGPMFKHAFKKFYPGMIEHRPSNMVNFVDHQTMTVSSDWDSVKANVINIVPMQRAGKLCDIAGVRTDSAKRWCPVNFATYESKSVPNIHIIGDSVLSNMPKSAHVANNQGKITAGAIIELLNGRQPDPLPIIGSTSYSATSDNTSGPIAVVMRYDPDQDVYARQPGGGADAESDELNFQYNLAWFENIWADTLGLG
jgi:NADPH-dependent 2,4-dienoyl-CoA reductase/sulfur reductase-like enzyme